MRPTANHMRLVQHTAALFGVFLAQMIVVAVAGEDGQWMDDAEKIRLVEEEVRSACVDDEWVDAGLIEVCIVLVVL